MNNMLLRTITGSLYITLIVFSVLIHPIALAILTALLNFLALGEFFSLFSNNLLSNMKKWKYLNSGFFILSILFIFIGVKLKFNAIPLLLLPIVFFLVSLFSKKDKSIQELSLALFGSIYISLPLFLLNLVQQFAIQQSIEFVLSMFILIWVNDTFAYLTGLAIGRHKIFERVSPKKTWEGFMGGLIFAIGASLIFNHIFPDFGLTHWIVFGAITSLAAVFGDFIESQMKRSTGAKDSGTLMPGHGGILDRIDSLLFATPLIFMYLLIFLN